MNFQSQEFEQHKTTEQDGSPNHTHYYQQGECNRRLREMEVYTWAIDLNYCLRGSAAGTTADPCSHRTTKGELNPKSYSINEKGNSGYLFILPIA